MRGIHKAGRLLCTGRIEFRFVELDLVIWKCSLELTELAVDLVD